MTALKLYPKGYFEKSEMFYQIYIISLYDQKKLTFNIWEASEYSL